MMEGLGTIMVGLGMASRPLMGVVRRGSGKVKHIDGRVDGDEGSVANRGEPSTQSLLLTIIDRSILQCQRFRS